MTPSPLSLATAAGDSRRRLAASRRETGCAIWSRNISTRRTRTKGARPMRVKSLEILRCDAGWRNYHFLKLTTDEGIIGWSEFDEGFGSPGVGAVIERLAGRVVGQPAFDHERIYTELYCFTRPAAGGVVAEGLGAIENALLDAKAKALGVPCYALLGGKLRR